MRRVKSQTVYACQIKAGDVLVIQNALIREDGSHKLPVIATESSERFVWLTFEGGRRERYKRYCQVNLGIEY